MIYFTSDLHFCHDKKFLYTPRGFESIVDHDTTIIQNWNNIVGKEDEVYILGDLMLNDNEHGIECINQLNGIKHFIRGNHDTDTRLNLYRKNGLIDEGYATIFKYKKYHFLLSHYPTITGNYDDKGLTQMTLNLYGHTHQQDNFYENIFSIYHVGMDSHNCQPVSIEEIIEDIKQKRIEKEREKDCHI